MSAVSVAGKLSGKIESGSLGPVDIGTLEPGDEVAVYAWGVNADSLPVLTHSLGPGELRVRTVPDKKYFFEVVFPEPSSILTGVLIVLAPIFVVGLLVGTVLTARYKTPPPSR